MGRRSRALTGGLVLLLPFAACGDPLIVLGDAPGFMRVVAGVGDSIGTRVDSLATRTRFTDPTAVAFDDDAGTLYVADQGALFQSGGVSTPVARIFAVASNGRLDLLMDRGGCAAGRCLQRAEDMVLDAAGNLLITDLATHRIYRFDPSARVLTVVAGTGAPGSSPDGTPAAQAALATPTGIAVGDDGRIFVAERTGHRVRAIGADGVLRTIAGTGQAGSSGDGGPALGARLTAPEGLAVRDGVLYVVDAGSHRVRAIDLAAGTIRALAGDGVPGFTGDGGPALSARLDRPEDVAVTDDGLSLFISDSFNDRVRVVNLRSGTMATFAGTGDPDYNGPSGPAGQLSLRRPTALATSPLGFLFIADTGHYVIWRTAVRF